MWRPRNETADDLEREGEAAAAIEAAWNVRAEKLSESLYALDWAFFRGEELMGWGEFKCRARRYPTLILSAAKYLHGCQLATYSGRPFILFVRWPDGLYWYRCGDGKLPIKRAGNDRGQNGDKEPCVHIETSLFRRV